MSITILSYNIQNGFHKDHVFEPDRLEAAKRIVATVKPDILALTEACYGVPNAKQISMNYQTLFGFKYGCYGSFPEFGQKKEDHGGNCLLSQIPMQAQVIPLAYKNAVRGKFEWGSHTLTLDVVHPSYSVDDAEKITTHKPLLESRVAPYILTGDFNTVHPQDQYDWVQMEQELDDFKPEKTAWIIENWKKAEFVSWLLNLGLRDAFSMKARASTVPTNKEYGERRNGVRMDFFFTSSDIKVIDAYVLKNSDTQIASDHYPIVGIFDIE